jgi:hypothetical protein
MICRDSNQEQPYLKQTNISDNYVKLQLCPVGVRGFTSDVVQKIKQKINTVTYIHKWHIPLTRNIIILSRNVSFVIILLRYRRVRTDSGAHPTSYPMGTRGSFNGSKAVGGWSWPLTSIQCRGQECVELYLHSPNTSSWRGGQSRKSTGTTSPSSLGLLYWP